MLFLVKDVRQKPYFWPLVLMIVLGLFLDIHSTCFCVVNVGIWGEQSDFIVFLFHGFESLGVVSWLSILLAMLTSKMILLVAVALAFSTIVWAFKSQRVYLNIILCGIFILFLSQAIIGCLNYYHYFLL